MLPILIACLIWLPALAGLGSPLAAALRRVSGAPVSSVAIHTTLAGLLGIFVASTAAALANFWVAVYPVVSLSILLTGWLLAVCYRRRWRRLPASSWCLAAIILLIVSLVDARGMAWYDTGLYHLQSVRWLTTGPLPQGLANLYGCLGYNCSWFTFAAAVETPLLLGKSCFIVNALVAFLFALPALDVILRHRGRPLRADRLTLALMLLPLGYFGVDVAMISSLAPDAMVMLLILFCIALWVRSARFAPQILALACLGVTIKLSALPLLGIGLIAAAAWAMRFPRNIRRGLLPAAFCLTAAAIFLARGFCLSGYLAYPSMAGRISSLPWVTPTSIAIHTANEIESWSRYRKLYDKVTPGTPWLASWVHRIVFSEPMLIAYAALIGGIVAWSYRRRRLTTVDMRSIAAAFCLLPALAFWWLTAPQVRFGYGYIFGLASLSLALGVNGASLPKIDPRRFRLAVAISMLCLLLCMRIGRQFLRLTLLRWPAIPTATLEPHQTKDGLTVQMPFKDARVWNAPPPATPELDPDLKCDKDAAGNIRRFYIVRPD